MVPVTAKTTKKASTPIKAGVFKDTDPQFVRVPDIQRMAGIKRGLCYRKISDGTFRSVLLREPGNTQGVRLIFWPSVKAFLHKLMEEQSTASNNPTQETSA